MRVWKLRKGEGLTLRVQDPAQVDLRQTNEGWEGLAMDSQGLAWASKR